MNATATDNQPEFTFGKTAESGPNGLKEADLPALAWFEGYLKEVGRWMTAVELLTLVGKEEASDGPRWIRMLAQASEWVISGQKGYKHLSHATAEEVNRFVNWMESQGKKMIGRAERMRQNAHAAVG